MDVDGPAAVGTKPLLIVTPDPSEDSATRDARPPASRYGMPLSYKKTSSQLFIGDSHFYIFIRLYHVILERLAAAKEMASKAEQLSAPDDGAESQMSVNGLDSA